MSKFLVKCTIIVLNILFGVCLSEKERQLVYHGLHDGLPFSLREHPYLVSVSGNIRRHAADPHYIDTTYYACTGVLITLDWVLTGGRCGHLLRDALHSDLLVYAGSRVMDYTSGVNLEGEVISASKILHYQEGAYPDFTVAFFKLARPFNETDLVKPVNFSKALNHTFRNCRRGVDVFGFVPMKSNVKINLELAPLPLRNYDLCADAAPSIKKMSTFALCVESRLAKKNTGDEHLDEAPRVLCQEDVGMPAFCKGAFVGITHSLYKTPLYSLNCTPANASSVFLWTDGILEWIGEKSGVDVSYTTTTTTTTTTTESPGGGGGHEWSGAAALSTREPILLLLFVYLCLYLV